VQKPRFTEKGEIMIVFILFSLIYGEMLEINSPQHRPLPVDYGHPSKNFGRSGADVQRENHS
jgi:hypothetical protein